MGQRSQIYFRINRPNGGYDLIARYFQWNYGTRMISRARYTIEWINSNKEYPYMLLRGGDGYRKLERIIDVNFDYKDIVLSIDILKEYEDDYYGDDPKALFLGQDNNDGQLLIDLYVDWERPANTRSYYTKIKYAFLDHDSELIGNGESYMQWNENYGDDGPAWRENKYIQKEIKYTERNIRYLDKNAKLMTKEEVNEYINHDYISDMGIKRKEN